MYIEHIAIWTRHLEELKAFYETYFQAEAGPRYHNPTKQFESYFLRFTSGARLELMRRPSVLAVSGKEGVPYPGITHLAFATGSEEAVDALTHRLHNDGYRVVDGPRRTGDGYYESVVLDPDGNRIEITV